MVAIGRRACMLHVRCGRRCVQLQNSSTAAACYPPHMLAAWASKANGGRRLQLAVPPSTPLSISPQCLADYFVYMPTRCSMKIQLGYRGRSLPFYAFLCTQ
ncbi:uncharacterized protein LOC123404299 [Hordeum vulgare subsp. vulgare]|uniref:uncharacterized protein LOC123404299 n=1 Tax=Hordeum vulgare subsp. vulgare TaxID=112509 RepID=UPI001D1A3F33|nr:uncharacterized protein LOC123404299 [Hordeum vulgare subsp. vulgare]